MRLRPFFSPCISQMVGEANNYSPLRVVYIKNVFLPLQKKTIMNRKEIVEKAKQAIRSVEPDAEIILFGSEARGDARPDSDIDLLVLLSGDKKSVDREACRPS